MQKKVDDEGNHAINGLNLKIEKTGSSKTKKIDKLNDGITQENNQQDLKHQEVQESFKDQNYG